MNCCAINMIRAIGIAVTLGLTACSGPSGEPINESGPTVQPFPVSPSYLTDHPSKIFMEAANYLEAGDIESAAIWFYAGQLRYRVLLDCNALKPTPQDLILFSAQFETMEPLVNNWGAQNLDRFVQILDEVVAWDEDNIETPANYASCTEARENVLSIIQTIRDAAQAQ